MFLWLLKYGIKEEIENIISAVPKNKFGFVILSTIKTKIIASPKKVAVGKNFMNTSIAKSSM